MHSRPAPLRSIAAAAVAAAWLALVAGSGGCEVAVGSAVPAFACDPGGDTCPSGQVCDGKTHQCVAGGCMVSGCQTGTCDPQSNVCMAADSGMIVEASPQDTSLPEVTADTSTPQDTSVPPVDTGTAETTTCTTLGCPCSGPAACDSKICSDMLTVTSGLYGVAGNFCTKPCCTSADCDANTVCFATGQGGDYCVEPTWLMRGTAIGAGLPGGSCATGRDCRSALCDTAAGKCIDTCCSSGSTTQCTGGDVCQFGKFAGAATIDQNYAAFCAQSGGGGQDGSSCSSNNSCEAKLCAFDGAGNICHGVCRGAGDCASGESCEYVLPTVTGMPMPPPVVAGCFSSSGAQAEGTTCTTANDMCAGFCDPHAMVCTDVCFADSDCKAGWRCRPESITPAGGSGSYSVLACGT